MLTGLATFALLISGIGLFGMASSLASRRTHEIGIRKVRGATPAGILRLLLWDFSKPVVWANLAVWPLAATWLLACVAVGACAWRAAKLHPAEALRN